MTLALLFISNFFTVFLLGFQNLNLIKGNKILAVITSIGISLAFYISFKLLPRTDFGLLEFLAYGSGGCLGIYLSMVIHEHFVPNKREP